MLVAFPYLRLVNADDGNGVQISNIEVHPSTIKVGDNFTITATLVNNSPNVISVHNDCLSPFSVTFDNHAKVEVEKPCIYFAISLSLNPSENRTGIGPGSNLVYRAVEAGVANATITYTYSITNSSGTFPTARTGLGAESQGLNESGTIGNQTSPMAFGSNLAISKSVSFTIYPAANQTAVILPPLAQLRSGIMAKDVKCLQGLELVFKAYDGSPACVTQDILEKLVSRGWALPVSNSP